MTRTVDAKFVKGKLEPLEPLPLKEGQQVRMTITDVPEGAEQADGLSASAGGWTGLLDVDAFLRDLEESRKQARPPAEL